MRAFLGSAISAIKAGGGEAWFETPAGERSAGATATRTEGPRVVVQVETEGRRFGRIELDPPASGTAPRPRDLAALHAAAERLALAMSGADASPRVVPSAGAHLPVDVAATAD